MDVRDKESQSEDFNINADQQLNEPIDYQELIEEVIFKSETIIAEEELIREGFRMKIEQLERENVRLKSNRTDLERQLSYLHGQSESNDDGDGLDFQSENGTLDEFVSNNLVTFKSVEKLHEQNQMLSNFARKLKHFEYRIDLENYMTKLDDYAEKWRQHAIQSRQVSNTFIKTIKVENEILRKKNIAMYDMAKSAIRESTVGRSIAEIQLKIQELLRFRQNAAKDDEQNVQDIRLCANQLNNLSYEAKKLTENNRKHIADVKIHEENSVIQLAQIKSLEKQNEHLTEVVKIQQADTANHLLQIQHLEKQNQTAIKQYEDLTEEFKLQEANIDSEIESCLKQTEYLETKGLTTTKHLAEGIAIRKAEISNYLEQIQSLEKQNHTTAKQNELLTNEMTILKQELINVENQINNVIADHQTEEVIVPDRFSLNFFDALMKRPNNQLHFDEPPTKNKRLNSQMINEKRFLERSTSCDDTLPITYYRRRISSHMIHSCSNKCFAAIKIPESTGEAGTERKRSYTGTLYNLRQNLKKKRFFE